MSDELVLQHPHVHDWRGRDGKPWLGQLEHAVAVTCECGEGAGDWSDVEVHLSVYGNAIVRVSDVWPDGDHPRPVTVGAVMEALAADESLLANAEVWNLHARAAQIGGVTP